MFVRKNTKKTQRLLLCLLATVLVGGSLFLGFAQSSTTALAESSWTVTHNGIAEDARGYFNPYTLNPFKSEITIPRFDSVRYFYGVKYDDIRKGIDPSGASDSKTDRHLNYYWPLFIDQLSKDYQTHYFYDIYFKNKNQFSINSRRVLPSNFTTPSGTRYNIYLQPDPDWGYNGYSVIYPGNEPYLVFPVYMLAEKDLKFDVTEYIKPTVFGVQTNTADFVFDFMALNGSFVLPVEYQLQGKYYSYSLTFEYFGILGAIPPSNDYTSFYFSSTYLDNNNYPVNRFAISSLFSAMDGNTILAPTSSGISNVPVYGDLFDGILGVSSDNKSFTYFLFPNPYANGKVELTLPSSQTEYIRAWEYGVQGPHVIKNFDFSLDPSVLKKNARTASYRFWLRNFNYYASNSDLVSTAGLGQNPNYVTCYMWDIPCHLGNAIVYIMYEFPLTKNIFKLVSQSFDFFVNSLNFLGGFSSFGFLFVFVFGMVLFGVVRKMVS